MINSNIQKAILFIDAKIADYQTLAAGVEAGTEVIILDATKDGISQITEELANRHDITGVHIVSHGAPGCVYLGNAQLSLDTLSKYAQQLKQWFVAGESASPSLFLYGCQVAAGDAGTEFLAKLRTLTGANIAASANLTGNAALGGDWELEVTLGDGEFAPIFASEVMAAYPSVLDTTPLPSFINEWLNNNPNVTATTVEGVTTASYNGTVDISAAINQIASKLKLGSITQQIQATNPKLIVKGYPNSPTYYELSVSQLPAGQIMDGLGKLTGAQLFKGLSSTGNVDLVLASNGIKVDYADAVKLDLNSVIDTSNASALTKNGIDQVNTALSANGAAINLTKSSLLVTRDTETEIKIESTINGEKASIHYRTPTNFHLSLPDFDGIDLSNLLKGLIGKIPGINLPSINFPSFNFKGFDFDLSFLDGLPSFKFSLPSLNIGDLKSLFGSFNFSFPDLDFLFNLPNLPKLSFNIGTDFFSLGGLNLNFGDFLKGFGINLPSMPSLNFQLPSLDFKFLNGLPNLEIPSIGLDFIKDLIPNIDISFAKQFLQPIIDEGKKFKVEPTKNELKITYLDSLNIQTIVNSLSSELGLGTALNTSLSVKNPGLKIKKDPKDSQKRLYEVSIAEINPGEVINLLATVSGATLPSNIQSKLTSIGNASFALSKEGMALKYLDNITLDLNDVLGNLDATIKDAVNQLTAGLVGDGDPNKDGTQLVLAQPALKLIKKENQKELSLAGTFNGQELGINVNGKDVGFSFEIPSLNVTTLKNAFSKLGALPDFVNSFLGALQASAKLKVESNKDGFNITYLDSLNIQNIVNTLSTELGLGSALNSSLSVKNPGLKIKKDQSGQRLYEMSIGEISPGEIFNLLATVSGTTLPDSIKSKLQAIGNASLTLSKQGIALTYLDNITLNLNDIAGTGDSSIGFINDAINKISSTLIGDGDPNAPGTQLVLSQPKLEVTKQGDQKQLSLDGIFNGQKFDLDFLGAGKTNFSYDLPNNIDFGSLLGGIPVLKSFKLENPELIFANAPQKINDKTLGVIDVTQGFNFTGDLNFGNNTDDFSKFIANQLGVKKLGVQVGLDPVNGASLTGVLAGNVPLLSVGNFNAKLNNAGLKLAVDKLGKPSFGIEGGITLAGYDPVQSNEPALNFSGGLALDPTSLTGKFQLDAASSWKNPFGLPDAELRNIALQLGGTYLAPYIDNVGFLGDLKFGNFNMKSALLVDTNDPNKFALELTANQPVSLVDLITGGPIGSYVTKQIGKESNVVKDAMSLLNKVIDVKVESIDGPDVGTELDPLIKFVPVETKIANTTLTQGIGVHGKLTAWGKEATLNLEANPFGNSPSLTGSLQIPTIDLGIVKLSGSDDPNVDLALKVSPTEQYLKGDAKLNILGKEVAKAQFEVTPTSVNVKDFDLDFGLIGLDIDNLSLAPAESTASGTGKVKILGQEVAKASFNVTPTELKVNANLNLFGILQIEPKDGTTITINNSGIIIGGNVKFLGIPLAGAQITVQNGKLTIGGKIGFEVFGKEISAGITITSDGTLAGSSLTGTYNLAVTSGSVGPISLGSLRSLEDLGELILGETFGAIAEVVGQVIDFAVEGYNIISAGVLSAIDSIGEFFQDVGAFFENAWNDITSLGGNDKNDEYLENGPDTYLGTSGNDKKLGLPGDDFMRGDWGNDELNGGPGKDTIFGDGNNDRLIGEIDNDIIFGGGGDDRIEAGNNDDIAYGEDGSDRLEGWLDNDILGGGNGSDLIFGHAGKDTLYGGDGDDKLEGNEDDDVIYGDYEEYLKVDPYFYPALPVFRGANKSVVKYTGNKGNDLLFGGEGNDKLYGEVGDDFLDGGNHNDTLDGGVGNDILNGGELHDSLEGGADNDLLYGANHNDTLKGGSGNDVLQGEADNDLLYGGDNDDILYGDAKSGDIPKSDDTLYGEAGNDFLDGGAGNDYLDGGTENDLMNGGSGNDTLTGQKGNDQIKGGTGDDSLNGGDDNDILDGEDNNDQLKGGIGNDILVGGKGNDILKGEDNNDTLFGEDGDDNLAGNEKDDILSGDKGNDRLYGDDGNDTLKGEEDNDELHGWIGSDLLEGGEGNDTLYAQQDNDTLYGGAGDDILNGDEGNDTIYAESGNDTIDGGSDNDVLMFKGNKGEYTFTEENGWTKLTGNNSVKFVRNIEKFEFDNVFNTSSGNDSLSGYQENDTINGEAGDDVIAGKQGNDQIRGGTGDDQLYGDDGNDTLEGEEGNDHLHGWTGSDLLLGGDGKDTLWGQQDNDTLKGGAGDDLLEGQEADDLLFGGEGNDTLGGQQGNDTLNGDTGEDKLFGDDGNDLLDGQEGNDELHGWIGSDILAGGLGNDILRGQQDGDQLDGGAGDDQLLGDEGNDTVYGQDGNDHLHGWTGSDLLVGGFGKDTLWGQQDNDTLKGGAGDDDIAGNEADDQLYGDDGNDALAGQQGNDELHGGTGNDKLYGDEGNDALYGEQDNDELHGWTGSDLLVGGGGNDTLWGQQDNDILKGGAGNDVLNGDEGNDTIYAGSGNDTIDGGSNDNDVLILEGKESDYQVTKADTRWTITGNNSVKIVTAVEELQYLNLLIGGSGNDNLGGGKDNDTLYGGAGDDNLGGKEGDDLLSGDDGNDIVGGQQGNDEIYGGTGNDKLFGDDGNDTLEGEDGNDEIHGYAGSDLLLGGLGDDTLKGQQDNDTLSGRAGNDLLEGEEGDDILFGEDGNDIVGGQQGNDQINGGTGNDKLYGDDGNDTVYGENDNDEIHGYAGKDLLVGGLGNDTLFGELDNDQLQGGAGDDKLFGQEGNDTLDGQDGKDALYGGTGSDLLLGGLGNDTLFGEQDNDTLKGGAGNDILKGDEGNDTIYAESGNDTINGGSGMDILILEGQELDYAFVNVDGFFQKGDESSPIYYFDIGNPLQTITINGKNGEQKIVTEVEGVQYQPASSTSPVESPFPTSPAENPSPTSPVQAVINSEPVKAVINSEPVKAVINSEPVKAVIDSEPVKAVINSEPVKAVVNWFGSLFNGPLAGATVFVDTNGNLQADAGEQQTTTDNDGQYKFDSLDFATLDRNGDGKIDAKEGQIVGIGGIDTTTGLPATLPLISQIGSTSENTATTPLTTLKAVLSSQGIAAEKVETLLEKISGLPLASLSQPLDNFDPYTAIGKDDSSAINIASGHIKVMNLLLNGTAFLKAAKYQESDAEIQVIVALGEVLQKVDSFDLSKGDDLQKLFTQLTEKHNLSIASEPVKAVSELVAQSNHLVDDLVGQALTRSVSDVLPSISPIKKAVYSTLPEVTQQLIEGKITAQESQTKLQELLKADTFLVQYALNEKRTVKVTASPTITEGDSNSQGQFTIALGEAAPAQGLKILYTLSGTASLGQDYSTKGGQFGEINIPPGATEAAIDLSVLDDTLPEKPEALTLNLKYVGTGYALDPVYKTAVLQIADNDEQNSTNSQNGTRQTGTFGNDTLTGTAGDDNLSGNEGNDVLQGLAGNDQLTGGAGSDTVLGGEGSDKLEGNFGADILQGNAGDDAIAGGAENDTLEGNEGNDQLQANAGHDQLKGNTGNDLLGGGLGNDTLEGNEENDWLVGDAGQDILTGGAGVDLLNGGDGADVFFFNAPSDGGDLILDFDPTQGDKIQVSATGFNTKSLADFSVLAGTLQFKGQEIALIQNNGLTYNNFPNLGEILEIVDAPTAQPAPTAGEISAQTTPSVANPDLVSNPEVTILDDIIKRGQIKLAVSSATPKFDLEFVRTLAAAIFGDANKVEQVTTTFNEAVGMVANGTVDLTARRSTHTLGRDATLNVDFSPIYFYDYQTVIVRKDSGIENVLDLKGRTIGVIEGSTALGNLQNELSPEGVDFIPKSFANLEEVIAAYNAGKIDAFSTDSALITDRLKDLSDPENHRLLDVEFSKEPIALALPKNDSQWADVVRWVNYVPIQAEEFGISSENIDQIIAANTDKNRNNDSSPAIRRFLGLEGDLGASLGLPKDFAVNVIKQVGNYAEIYDRHFPGVERDRNLLWNEGGLLYSPPFSGTKVDATLIDNDDRNLLADVLQRGTLKLGLPGNNPGFTVKQANGEYVGFDVDLGRAIAAALFGDPSKLETQVQSFKDSFANTANGVVDVSAMGITQNLVRDASLGVDFSPTYLYTGQGVLVRDNTGISVLPALNGRRVGILEGATSLQNLQDSLSKYGGTFIPVKFATNDEMFAAYDKGEIDAVSTDLTILSARIPTLSNPAQHRILDEVLSKEPLGLITDENQSEWADVVRWVYNALVQAEEYGITSANIEELITQNTDSNSANESNSAIRQFLGLEGNIGKALGLPNDFAVKAIKAVGNYGEMYDRHFNSNVLRRDSNALAADFGLQYSPPFSGTTGNNTVVGTEGNDLLNGNSGDSFLNGNQGNDTLSGGQGNDTLWGGKGHDFVSGGKGHDILDGGKGNDTLNGDAGDDLLNGGKGNDILFGGKGNDILNGGAGDDLLNGGKGRDTFVLTPGNGTDTIADFTIGQDLLELAGGLKFEQLTITQGTGTQARDTLIRLVSTGAVLASLTDSSASSITPAMFTLN